MKRSVPGLRTHESHDTCRDLLLYPLSKEFVKGWLTPYGQQECVKRTHGSMQREVLAAAGTGAARMRAWRAHSYGPLNELRLEDARVPPLRAPDQLLVRVHTASLNPLDVAMLGGYGARMLNVLRSMEGVDVEFPLVVGRDFCGEVLLAGAASRLRAGRRVWGVLPPHWPGAHAQYVVLRDCWASEAPAALDSTAAGGALYAGLSACAALRAGGLAPRPPSARASRPAPRVLLLGLGGVGHAALQLLVYSGAQVTVGCAGERCARATALGAAAALDRHAADYDRRLEDCGPYDVILDCAGLGGAEAGSRRWRFARYVTLSSPLLREADARGLLPGAAAAAAALARHSWAAAGASPPAAPVAACPPHVRWAFFTPSAPDIELLRRLADAGKFAVEVEHVFPWWAGAEAYARAAAGGARGKLLLDFTATPPPTPTHETHLA